MARPGRNSDAGLIELFLDMLAAERGAGTNTLAAYARDLDDFSAHLSAGKGQRGAPWRMPRPTMCAAILAALGKRGFAAASMARRLSAIRQLYRFLYAEGRRSDDPAAIIEGPKRGRTLPKVLSIAAGRPPAGGGARRDGGRAAVAGAAARGAADLPSWSLLYATGLRVSELVALPASAAERNARMLVVRGKGGKERLVPLNDAAKRAMTEYRALLAEAAGRRQSSERSRAERIRNGCFPPSAKAATSPASISPAS